MGYLEDIIKKAYASIKEKPVVLLPAALLWIPSSLIGLMFVLLFKEIIENYNLFSIIKSLESDPLSLLYSLSGIVGDYVLIFFVLIIIKSLLDYYVRATYPAITKAIFQDKAVLLSEALNEAGKRTIPLIITNILVSLLIFAAIIALFIFFVLCVLILGPFGIIINILIFIVLLFVGIIYLVPFYLILDSVVVLEKKSGFEAIKKVFALIKNEKLNAWLLCILLFVTISIYLAFVFLFIDLFSLLIGHYSVLIKLVLLLVSTAYVHICSSLFYFYLKGKVSEEVH